MIVLAAIARYARHGSLALGATASIATSSVQDPGEDLYEGPGWSSTAVGDLEPTFVTSGPPVGFAITSEARGPDHAAGDFTMTVYLELKPDRFDTASARVVLTGDSSGPQDRTVEISAGHLSAPYFSRIAWAECPDTLCVENLLLTVSEVTPGASLTVSGRIWAILRGNDGDTWQDPDSKVTVEVTSLGAIRP